MRIFIHTYELSLTYMNIKVEHKKLSYQRTSRYDNTRIFQRNFLKNLTSCSIEKDLDWQYLEKLGNVSLQPIFILGLHRSGTSILYKTLGLTGCFNSVTAYHIIKYSELLYNRINSKEEKSKEELANFFKTQSQADRGIDRLEITPNFPEEYGFILTHRNYPKKLTSGNLPIFIELCKKIQFITDQNKPILLKNPLDFPNFMYIKKVFPDAKFIFIHRNPIYVTNSFIRAMQMLFKNKNPYTTLLSQTYEKIFDNPLLLYASRIYYSPNLPIGLTQIIHTSARNTSYFLKNINSLPKQDYVNIRYEDLCKEPKTNISKIMGFLKLKTKSEVDYNNLMKPRKLELNKEVERMQDYIYKKMKPYFSYCGYTSNDLQVTK